MSQIKTITIPDLGGSADVEVIEILVKAGDVVQLEQPIMTLEGDKATMDVPSSLAGTIKSVDVALGDKVSEGSAVATIEVADQDETQSSADTASKKSIEEKPVEAQAPEEKIIDIIIPDLSGANQVDVIDVIVKKGDKVEVEQSLITLEGDKATMEVPSEYSGTIESITVAVGDKVSEGQSIGTMRAMVGGKTSEPKKEAPKKADSAPSSLGQAAALPKASAVDFDSSKVYAGPAVRRLARELGVDLNKVKGSGDKGRILKQDVFSFVKQALQGGTGGGIGIPGVKLAPPPKVDFANFGPVEVRPLNKIKKLTGANLHRNWLTVPHVTQFAEADMTDLEAFRKANKKQAEEQGFKLTPLVFIMKAVVDALKEFPSFNASLDSSAENLIVKQYYNVGVAVDTPNGLVVPVIRDVPDKSMLEIAKELGEISLKAREKGLTPAEMSGGCFTLSSLGGIGGTAFTPIINSPEVAILGISRTQIKPVYQNQAFEPRLMLPLSLSYDHRVIDGAEGARFITFITNRLSTTDWIDLE